MNIKLMGIAVAVAVVVLAGIGAWAVRSPLAALNALASIDSRRATSDRAYGTLPRQRFDLYRPAGAAPAGGWPLVVFFYGGAWNRGERGDYRFVGEALAARGVMAMVADYRLHPQVKYPGFVEDCAAALAHGLEQAGGWGANPQRVFVMGHSAGAYNAAMLALDARWLAPTGHAPGELAGWIGLAGPYDFLPIKTPEVQAAFHHPDVPPDSQPIRHVAAAAAVPALLVVGTRDERIDPQRNTVGLARALRSRGVPVVLHEYEGAGHETLVGALAPPLRRLAPVFEDVVGFVRQPVPPKAMAAANMR